MSDMLTRLSVSISGKGDGKPELARKVVEAGAKTFGIHVTQIKDDRHGSYVSLELDSAALVALRDGAPYPFLNEVPLGDDVEVRDGAIHAKAASVPADFQGAVRLSPDGAPVAVTVMTISAVDNLLRDRAAAVKVLKSPEDELQHFGSARYVDQATIDVMVRDGAREEVVRIDARLAALGFRFREGA